MGGGSVCQLNRKIDYLLMICAAAVGFPIAFGFDQRVQTFLRQFLFDLVGNFRLRGAIGPHPSPVRIAILFQRDSHKCFFCAGLQGSDSIDPYQQYNYQRKTNTCPVLSLEYHENLWEICFLTKLQLSWDL